MRTRLLATFALLLALTACAGDDGAGSSAAQDASEPTAEATAAAADDSTGVSSETACDDGFRAYEHAAGTTCVPDDPQRVVTLQDQNALLPLWELGFRDVVGSVGSFDEDGEPYFRRMQDFDTSGVEFVSSYGEPNIEAVAALDPDLIVGSPWPIVDEGLYEPLSRIAPTVVIDTFDAPIGEVSMRFAELVGMEHEAQRLLAEYEARIDDLREAAGDPADTVISVIETAASGGADPGQFYISGPSGSVEEVLGDVGFARPAPQGVAEERTYLSVERLLTQDGDLLLRPVTQQSADEEAANTEAILGSPIWDRLNAVRQGQAHDIDGEATYGNAFKPRFAFIDVLEGYLADGLDTSGELPQVDVVVP